MIRNWISFLIGFICLGAVEGCNAGMEPQGPSAEEAQQQIAQLPPDQQIDLLRHSPLPKAEQDRRVAAIQAKYGLPATADSNVSKPGQPPVKSGQ
jgi:hypothetical protein